MSEPRECACILLAQLSPAKIKDYSQDSKVSMISKTVSDCSTISTSVLPDKMNFGMTVLPFR